MSKENFNISERIDELCNEKGYDYQTLSKKSGVPLSTLLNIVKGNSKNPGIFTISKISTGFDIPLSLFFKTDREKNIGGVCALRKIETEENCKNECKFYCGNGMCREEYYETFCPYQYEAGATINMEEIAEIRKIFVKR